MWWKMKGGEQREVWERDEPIENERRRGKIRKTEQVKKWTQRSLRSKRNRELDKERKEEEKKNEKNRTNKEHQE